MEENAPAADEAAKEKKFTIIVNGESNIVDSEAVSYEQVVRLAYPTPPSPDTTFSVTYRKAKEPSHEGSLVPGQSVEVKKDGTIFNVKVSGRS